MAYTYIPTVPFKDPERAKEYRNKYYQINHKKIDARARELFLLKTPEEKERIRKMKAAITRRYRENHPDRVSSYAKRAVRINKRIARAINIVIMGGKCLFCGYNKSIAALEFHHLNPLEKESVKESDNVNIDYTKFILLCANCHRELHKGFHHYSSLL